MPHYHELKILSSNIFHEAAKMTYSGQEIVGEPMTFGWKSSIDHLLQVVQRSSRIWNLLHIISLRSSVMNLDLPLLGPLRLLYPTNTYQQGERRPPPGHTQPLGP
jgi:hypothetical protein